MVVAVAGDARVAAVRVLGVGRFLVTRLDGSTFVARVVAGETTDGSLAEVTVVGGGAVRIRVSARVDLELVARVVANALAQGSAVLGGNLGTDDVLTATAHPGSRTELTPADRGREAEVRHLDRARRETARVRVLRRRRLADEMRALVEELGLHPDDGAGPQRQAVSDVRHVVRRVAPAGSRRPSWAGPPTGYPAWRAFSLHLVAEMSPGLGAATAISLTGAPVVGLGVGVMSVGTAVAGTFIKRWYGRRDKTLVDEGHGFAGRQRAYEAALRRKELLDPLLARMGITADGPAEPAPAGDFPARFQSYWARLLMRGGPPMIGATAATSLMFFGLPLWNAATHWAVAGVAAGLGPVAERYLRSRIVQREWALLDNVGREQDAVAASFDEEFVAQLHAVADRLDRLAGRTPPPVNPATSPVPRRSLRTAGLRWFGVNQTPGQYGDLARGTTDAASKLEKGTNKAGQPDPAAATDAAIDALFTGGARATLGTIINAFLDRNFVRAEYHEIVEQVRFDFGARMAEQVALERRTLQAMLADLHARLDAAEAARQRVRASAPSRIAHLRAAPLAKDPAQRPRGHQRVRAFLKLHVKQAVTMQGLMVGAYLAFNQDVSSVIVIGAVSTMLAGNFGLRYLFRRAEQRAVDVTISADRAKERVVDAEEAAARQEFLTEFWTRRITGDPVVATQPVAPKVLRPSDPRYPEHLEALAAHERERLMAEPRPWSLLGPRLVALQRLRRLAGRVREFAEHERRTGEGAPLRQARADLAAVWAAYKRLVKDGTPMPDDHELLSSVVPPRPPDLGDSTRVSGPRHSVYPSPVRQGAAWPHYGAVTIGAVRDVPEVPEVVLPVPRPPDPSGDVAGGSDGEDCEEAGDGPAATGGDEGGDGEGRGGAGVGDESGECLTSGVLLYSGAERLWPDELADLIAASPGWGGGPVRLVVRDGSVDAEFVRRLAGLLGVDVLVAPDSVRDGGYGCSSGTVFIFAGPAVGAS